VQNLREILERSTPRSLVLIDELGAGTDPGEGAALAGAILEELTGRGALTVATTHLGALKMLATELPAVVNASLQFDSALLAPTYELVKGRPGRSYGLSIARRLNVPGQILARAETRLSAGERDLAALLEELEGRERNVRNREQELVALLNDARSRATTIGEREQRVRARERELEQAGRQEARRYLLDARAEVESAISELRARRDELEDASRVARRRVEELAAAESVALEQTGDRAGGAAAVTDGAPDVGDWVEVQALGGVRGRIVERRGQDVVVAVGAMKMTIRAAGCTRSRA